MQDLPGKKTNEAVRVVQFTDTHLFADPDERLVGVDTYRSLKMTVEAALSDVEAADIVLLTGDLSQDETSQSYLRLKEILSDVGLPVFYLPGNHDRLELMREVFSGVNPAFPADTSFTMGSWQIIMLDSTHPGRVEGIMAESELIRLNQALKGDADKYALICLHHSPVDIGADWMDEIGLTNKQEFLRIIDRYDRVKAILWGHIHQAFDSLRNGVKLMASPSTCVQFKERTAEFGVDNKPPGYRWLDLMPDGSICTGVPRLPELPQGLKLTGEGY